MEFEKDKALHVDAVNGLTYFFEKIRSDSRIGPIHIAVYTALLNVWINRMFQTPLVVFSSEVMPVAKISGRYNYQRALRELNLYGYLVYRPSMNKYKGSRIYLG